MDADNPNSWPTILEIKNRPRFLRLYNVKNVSSSSSKPEIRLAIASSADFDEETIQREFELHQSGSKREHSADLVFEVIPTDGQLLVEAVRLYANTMVEGVEILVEYL